MRAWWTYWATLVAGVVIWTAALVVGGRQGLRSMLANPGGLLVLVAPIVIAGLNLVLYRESHEEVCRIEVQRHRSLQLLAGSGYAARTFALTGVGLLALAGVIVVLQLGALA
ncbi:MAG: hypothetical protein ACJ769_00055 [Chloroflexota bacterium]